MLFWGKLFKDKLGEILYTPNKSVPNPVSPAFCWWEGTIDYMAT